MATLCVDKYRTTTVTIGSHYASVRLSRYIKEIRNLKKEQINKRNEKSRCDVPVALSADVTAVDARATEDGSLSAASSRRWTRRRGHVSREQRAKQGGVRDVMHE